MQFDTLILPGKAINSRQEFVIYRGDLECSVAPGNKQHKLKYPLREAVRNGHSYVATFGGPHSNHIAAFVARCQTLGLKPLVVVRGEIWPQLTPTLKSAVVAGAILFPSSRKDYRLGLASHVKQTVDEQYSNVYWIPEGGAGPMGVLGCLEWAKAIMQAPQAQDAHVCIASGTCATAAGFAASGIDSMSVFSALKGAQHLEQDIEHLCAQTDLTVTANLTTFDESEHGGFGRITHRLVTFLQALQVLNPDVYLDPVYTSKMIYHVHQLHLQGDWPHRRTLFIHTGGLQGWQGMKANQQPYGSPNRFSC